MKEKRNAYKVLVETPEGKRPLGRWGAVDGKITVKRALRKGWEGVGWIHVQDRDKWRAVVSTVMNIRVS
jgi:hypothetical protein